MLVEKLSTRGNEEVLGYYLAPFISNLYSQNRVKVVYESQSHRAKFKNP